MPEKLIFAVRALVLAFSPIAEIAEIAGGCTGCSSRTVYGLVCNTASPSNGLPWNALNLRNPWSPRNPGLPGPATQVVCPQIRHCLQSSVRLCLRSRSVLGEGEKWRPRAGVGDPPDGEHARRSSLSAEHQTIQSRATWIATCMLSRRAARRRCYRLQVL